MGTVNSRYELSRCQRELFITFEYSFYYKISVLHNVCVFVFFIQLSNQLSKTAGRQLLKRIKPGFLHYSSKQHLCHT